MILQDHRTEDQFLHHTPGSPSLLQKINGRMHVWWRWSTCGLMVADACWRCWCQVRIGLEYLKWEFRSNARLWLQAVGFTWAVCLYVCTVCLPVCLFKVCGPIESGIFYSGTNWNSRRLSLRVSELEFRCKSFRKWVIILVKWSHRPSQFC